MNGYYYLQQFLDILRVFSDSLSLILFSLIFADKWSYTSKQKMGVVGFVTAYSSFVYWTNFMLGINGGFAVFYSIAFACLCFSLISGSKISMSTLCVSTAYGIVQVVKLVSGKLLSFVNPYLFRLLGGVDISFVISFLFCLLIIFYLNKKNINFTKNRKIIHKQEKYFVVFLIISMTFIGILYTWFGSVSGNTENVEFITTLVFILMLFYGIHVNKLQETIRILENKLELRNRHVKNSTILLNLIRREKHDYDNHINTIYAMCKMPNQGQNNMITEYVEKFIAEKINTYRLYDTGNMYLDALLAVKSNVAHVRSISLEVSIDAPFSRLNIDSLDLISIISNLIDNAFDATENISADSLKEPLFVDLSTHIEDNYFHLKVANNGSFINESEVKNLFSEGYSTKKQKKKKRGYGLSIIKGIVDAKNGELNVSSDEFETVFSIKIPLT